MSAEPALASSPRPPSVAPLELARLRNSVRAGLFQAQAAPPRVGRYELLRCIGQGGMGIVYAARDVELGREVAIKLLRPELSASDDGRLTSEARALARLSHPNVVAVFDVGTYEGQRFIAMEYVVGQELRRWLEAPRSLREALRMFVEAGRGLHAAHEVGLVHRDFKPDNVLVGDDGRPRVLDFGLARPPDGEAGPGRPPALPAGGDPLATMLTGVGQVLGTPAYMAPEQHLGEPADARSDQFSFAVALYHAVYGVRPFSGQDLQALALSIVRGRVRPATPRYAVPPWLEQLLVRALAVDPGQRFASMKQLLEVIEKHLDAGEPGLDERPTRAMVDELAELSHPGIPGLDSGSIGEDSLGLAPTLHVVPTPQAMVPAAPASAPAPRFATEALALPPEEDLDGQPTSLSTRRTLPPMTGGTIELLVRELQRIEGRKGTLERLGSCATWSSRELEVHIDVSSEHTELLVWRKLGRARRRRTFGWMAMGMWLGSMFVAAVAGADGLPHGMEPPFVIGSLIGGGYMGYRKARARGIRALPSERARVEFIADRLVRLSQANPALAPGVTG